MAETDGPAEAKSGPGRLRSRVGKGGAWASPRWYLAYLISFEAGMVIVMAHNAGMWRAVSLSLILVSLAVLVGNVMATRRRKREGWVPIGRKSRPDVAGIRSIGQWRRPEDEG
jgi:hypothetical protein